ncbi:MAG: hypothetical protein ABH851_06235 [Methanobacteriota archaeon]
MHVDYGVCVKKGIDVFKDNALAFIIATFIAIIGMIPVITAPPLIAGLFYMADKGMKGRKVEVSDIFEGLDYLIPSLIYGLIVLVGLMVFVVPGVVILILGIYAMPILVIDKVDGLTAVKKALNFGKENFLDVLGVSFMTMVLVIVGESVFMVGSLITIPIAIIAITKAYEVSMS